MENKVKVEIEVGNAENLDEAVRVSKKVFEPTEVELKKYHDVDDWKEKIGKGGVLIVGKVDGVVVGFIVSYRTGDDVMHVWNAGVLAEYRRLGIFSNMFEELAIKCKQDGIKKLTLHTIEKKFPEMYKYVINRGFVEFEREWIDDEKVGRVEKSKFELMLEAI